ncbi:glycosyltransferase family 39 protein [Candidatus Curtissbacteria bacterium]|nr:glycosyltransferase family 39 protein [Candidatus Curtissbacteria bacterium]
MNCRRLANSLYSQQGEIMKNLALFERFPKLHFLIPVVVFLLYVNALGNGFVLDDPSQVVSNPAVVHFNLPGLFLGSSFGEGGRTAGVYYKPLMTTAYALLFSAFGNNAWDYHLLQITFHAANALLVFYILKKLLAPEVSLFLALVFAVHPFNSEAVLYIADLQDVMFFFFGALAFLMGTREQRLGTRNLAIAASFMLCSLLSKETGIVFLVLAIFYRLMFMFDKKNRNAFYQILGAFLGVFVLYFLLRLGAVGVSSYRDDPYPIMRLNLPQRLINIPEEGFYYIRNFFYPHDFAMAQHWVVLQISWQYFWYPLIWDMIFVTGLLGVGLWALKVGSGHFKKTYLFFLAWFAVGMVPHLNIVPLDVTAADRWFYFPVVGLVGLIGILIQEFSFSIFHFPIRKALPAIAVLLIVVLAARTFVRTFDWRNGLSLATRDIHFSRDSFPLENNFAFELINVGRYEEALVHANRSTELGPWWWLNWNNVGVIYRHLGYKNHDPKQMDLAVENFKKGAQNTSSFVLPYENAAEVLVNYKSPEESTQYIVDSSKRVGLTGRMAFLLAVSRYKAGDTKGALEAADRARNLMPGDQRPQLFYEALSAGKKVDFVPPEY